MWGLCEAQLLRDSVSLCKLGIGAPVTCWCESEQAALRALGVAGITRRDLGRRQGLDGDHWDPRRSTPRGWISWAFPRPAPARRLRLRLRRPFSPATAARPPAARPPPSPPARAALDGAEGTRAPGEPPSARAGTRACAPPARARAKQGAPRERPLDGPRPGGPALRRPRPCRPAPVPAPARGLAVITGRARRTRGSRAVSARWWLRGGTQDFGSEV